jgi:hypothetical protein
MTQFIRLFAAGPIEPPTTCTSTNQLAISLELVNVPDKVFYSFAAR